CGFFFFSSRRRHTRSTRDWSSDVCSSDLFSPAPLRLATGLGAVTFALCVVAVVLAMVSYATGHTVSGWASLIIAVLFLGAVQLRSEERRVGKEGRAGRSTPRDEDRIHNTH